MKNFIVNEEVMLGVLNYLSNQPFKEVAGLIQKLQMSQLHKEEPKIEEGEKDADNSRP
jgi:cytochrome c553